MLILTILGIILFLYLLVIITLAFLKDKPYLPFLFTLILPIVMIGFSAIKSFNFNQEGINFETIFENAVNCATDKNTTALRLAVKEIEQKEKLDPETFLTYCEAKLFLGESYEIDDALLNKTKFKTEQQELDFAEIKEAAAIQQNINKWQNVELIDSTKVITEINKLDQLDINPAIKDAIEMRSVEVYR